MAAAHRPMTDEAFEAIARRFRVLSEPMRLKILYHLREGSRTVGELVEATGGTQSNVSRHLSTLLAAGIVERRRDGVHAVYSIPDASIFDLCDRVCGGIERELSSRSRALRGARGAGARGRSGR